MSNERLAISEVFGETIQGEGVSIGEPVYFLRLAGCNLKCVFCDTPYTWNWEKFDPNVEIKSMSVEHCLERILERGQHNPLIKSLVVTGGEPMLQWRSLGELIDRLRVLKWRVQIETAGTVTPPTPYFADQYNVSPKLINSGNALKKRYHPETLDWFARSPIAWFKFVVMNEQDLLEVDELVKAHAIPLPHVYIMLEGIDQQVLQRRAQELLPAILQRGYHLTPRFHIELFGNRRGV